MAKKVRPKSLIYESMKDVLEDLDSYGDRRMCKADKYNFLRRMRDCAETKSGKWMCFEPIETVDSVWKSIVDGVLHGRLGTTAKVATSPHNDRYVICVYVDDFDDTKEVERVLKNLLQITNITAGFKPDFMTTLGNYTSQDFKNKSCRNLHKIPTCIYQDMLKRVKQHMEGTSPAIKQPSPKDILLRSKSTTGGFKKPKFA